MQNRKGIPKGFNNPTGKQLETFFGIINNLKEQFNIKQEDKYMIFTIGFFMLGSFFGFIISIIAFSLLSMNRINEEE